MQFNLLKGIIQWLLVYSQSCATITTPIREHFQHLRKKPWGFPGGSVVKNLPANAGDTGSNPGPGRFHMLQSNEAHVLQLRSLRSRACKPQLLSPHATTTEACVPRACAPQQERPLQ